jgi:hypothetical protein
MVAIGTSDCRLAVDSSRNGQVVTTSTPVKRRDLCRQPGIESTPPIYGLVSRRTRNWDVQCATSGSHLRLVALGKRLRAMRSNASDAASA